MITDISMPLILMAAPLFVDIARLLPSFRYAAIITSCQRVFFAFFFVSIRVQPCAALDAARSAFVFEAATPPLTPSVHYAFTPFFVLLMSAYDRCLSHADY